MDELHEFQKKLAEFKKLLNSMNYLLYYRMPPLLIETNLDILRDEIKFLTGYVDCMVHNKIPLLPESD